MRSALLAFALAAAGASPLLAQEQAKGGLLSLHGGLMFWTLLIFLVLFATLAKFAFPPIVAAVEARERALEEAIEGAKRDREEAAKYIEEQRRLIDAARTEAQKLIADGRSIGEKLRAEMIEQTHAQQADILERARREIGSERDRAIAELRREAVELAIAGASKVIEKDLDDEGNRRLVEGFLSSLTPVKQKS
jgi:F-type H+-transporting ATPase subunit b